MAEFISALVAYGAWPLPPTGLGAALLWLPWGLLTARLVRRKPAPNLYPPTPLAPLAPSAPFAPFAWCLGLWVLLQVATLAWARAGLLPLVSSRYTEVLVWGTVANAACLMVILPFAGSNRRVRWAQVALIAVWFGAVGGFEVWRSEAIYQPFFTAFRGQTLRQQQRLETFMRTDDARGLEAVQIPEIPYFAPRIIPLMRDRGIASLLPSALRRPRAERGTPSTAVNSLPVPGGAQGAREGPLTRTSVWLIAHGTLLAALGAAELLAIGCTGILRRRKRLLAPIPSLG